MEKGSFIWRALKVCKTFKVKFLKIPRLKVPAKKTASNLFYKDIWDKKRVKGGHHFSSKGHYIKEIE